MNIYPPLDLDSLLAPLDDSQPAGCFDEEDETFQAIDHEMVKLGTLHESSIDWAYVDEASRQYLNHQCKHFRIAGHLMTARTRAGSWQAWTEAVDVLAGLVEHYWETGHPKPGPTGYLAKRKLVAMLVERLGDALPRLDTRTFSPPFPERAQHALDRLQGNAAQAQLDAPMLSRLESRLRQRVEESRFPESSPPLPSPGQQGGTSVTEAFFQNEGMVKSGDDRENRRSLLAVAEFINKQDAYDPTGYQLRRFAIWAHLNAAPPARRENRTELMGVPVDVEEAYRETMAGNHVTPALLQRVEKSVTTSPYWLCGSYLSAGIAARLEMPEVADGIRLAVKRFLLRLPALAELRFSDGRPFANGETIAWISGSGGPADQHSHAPEYASLRVELAALMEAEGVEVVLRKLQDLQAKASTPRQRHYAMVTAADLLSARGLNWLANDLYAGVDRAMRTTTAEAWEPDLFGHLSRHLDSSNRQ